MLLALLGGSVVFTLFALYMTYVRIRTILRSMDAIERRKPIPPMAPWILWAWSISMIVAPGVSVWTAFTVFDRVEHNILTVGGPEFIISMLCLLLCGFNMFINFSIYDRSRPSTTYW